MCAHWVQEPHVHVEAHPGDSADGRPTAGALDESSTSQGIGQWEHPVSPPHVAHLHVADTASDKPTRPE